MRTRNRFTIYALPLVTAAVLTAGCNSLSSPRQSTAQLQSDPIHVGVEPVNYTNISRGMSVTGVVKPHQDAMLAAQIMARVVSINVHQGDAVTPGEVLATLDSSDMNAARGQAAAGLAAARVGVRSATVAATMTSAMSTAKLAEARAQLAQAEAAYQTGKAKLALVLAGPRRQEKAQAMENVAQAKAGLALAQSNKKRMADLFSEGAISAQQYDQVNTQYSVALAQYQSAVQGFSIAEEGSRREDIDAARTSVTQAKAAVAQALAGIAQARAGLLQAAVSKQAIQSAAAQAMQAQAALQSADINQAYTVIKAPFAGVIAQRLADPGSMASPGVPILEVQGTELRLEAVVPQSQVALVKLGQILPVSLDALPGKSFMGKVSEIAPQGDPSSHTFVVKVTLPANPNIRAGMYGRTSLAQGSDRRLLVPTEAISDLQGMHAVFVLNSGSSTVTMRLVTLGAQLGKDTIILSGLQPGDRVITQGAQTLHDGSVVTING